MRISGVQLRTVLTLAALLCVLSYLYHQATSRYHAQHQEISQELDELRRVDAELGRDALRVRTGLLRQYDPLSTGLDRLTRGVERLRAEGLRDAYGAASPDIHERLTRLAKTLAESEERLEQFKSATAVLNNSLLYLLVLQRELAAEANLAWQVELSALVNALLRYARSAEGQTANDAELLLRRLAATAASARLRAGAETLSRHARLALSHGALADAALHGFMSAPPGAQLRALEEAYVAHHRGTQERADFYRTLLYAVSLLLLGYLGYLMVSLERSITERKRAEATLQDLNQGLESRVTERTSELQALAREREAFSYSIAHDLRSPLGVISGFSHLLAKDEGERLSPEGRRILGVIESNVAHLVSLVDALLTLAQVSRARLERRIVDLRQITQAAADALAPRYPRTQIAVGELPQVSGDPTLLAQVLSNLLENALKYSSRQVMPQVSIGWHAEALACYVRDNGIGFDMSHAGNLFNAFERLHTDQEFPGSGVGLAIVRRVVERHGGRVWANAAPEQGATFYFTLSTSDRNEGEPHSIAVSSSH